MPCYQCIEADLPDEDDLEAGDDVTVIQLVAPWRRQLEETSALSEILDVIEREKPRKLVLSFEQIRLDREVETAINNVIFVYRRLKQYGGELKLCGLSEYYRECFRILKIDSVFSIYASVTEAIDAF